MPERHRFAWMIASVLFAGSVVNYIDRAVLSVLMQQVRADLVLTNAQYGLASRSVATAAAASHARQQGSRSTTQISMKPGWSWTRGQSRGQENPRFRRITSNAATPNSQ